MSHIRDAVHDAVEFAGNDKTAFLKDRKSQAAVIRCLEVIGEAVKNLSSTFRESHPEVTWRRIAGMRDFLIHSYFNVDLNVMWSVVSDEIPRLRRVVDSLIESPDVHRR